ncbi:MAG: response regulator [Anaerolineae bacterium]|nr:response regulator [Anaerolineae bacterium]
MPRISEVTIVLVEDNEGHARLIEKNLRRANISNTVIKLEDGQRVLDYLFGEQGYVNVPQHSPLLVLLDLNLPVVNGYRVLEKMKSDDRTKKIPVVILTTTDDIHEINRCYELGANVYLTKPVEYEQFAEAIARLGLFLSIVMLPDES